MNPSPGNQRRSKVLDEIRAAVCKDRNTQYGDAEDNFQNIADYWNLWLRQRKILPADKTLTAVDVAGMSALLKTARIAVNVPYKDSWVDLAGYAVCGAGIVQRGEESAATTYAAALNAACKMNPDPKWFDNLPLTNPPHQV